MFFALLDEVKHNIDMQHGTNNFNFVGSQSIALPHRVIPVINFSIDYGKRSVVYDSWFGSNNELTDAYKKRFPQANTDELHKLETVKDWNQLGYKMLQDEVANITNAHTSRLEFDHAGDGCVTFHPFKDARDWREMNEQSFQIGVTE